MGTIKFLRKDGPSRIQILEVRKYTGSLPPLGLQDIVYPHVIAKKANMRLSVVMQVLPLLGYSRMDSTVFALKSRPSILRRLWWWGHDYQPITWVGHIMATAALPLVASFAAAEFFGWHVHPLVVACWICGYYGVRESKDHADKVRAGILHKQDRQGVTGFVDGIFDWLGPLAVTLGYACVTLWEFLAWR